MRVHFSSFALAMVVCLGTSGVARAQVDLSGEWALRMHEDQPWRGPGQLPGEFQGLPINAGGAREGRKLERVCLRHARAAVHPVPGGHGLHLRQHADLEGQGWPVTGARRLWSAQRVAGPGTHDLDGRPSASAEWAPHTWQGFSTGEWIGNALKVTTTHLKMAYLERNGVPRSDQATVVEYYARHDNVLTIVTIVTDPVYLTEPLVRTRNFAAAPTQELNAYPCRPAVEIDRQAHTVPHYLPGTNPSLDTANNGSAFRLSRSAAARRRPIRSSRVSW